MSPLRPRGEIYLQSKPGGPVVVARGVELVAMTDAVRRPQQRVRLFPTDAAERARGQAAVQALVGVNALLAGS